jgi:hypothetical protein
LNVLQEVWDMFDSVSTGSQISEVEDVSDQVFLAISEAVVSGISAPRTLKITSNIQHMDLLILIDSGSSHSFISSQLVDCLQGVTIAAKHVGVRVANGTVMQSTTELMKAEWFIQGYTFQCNLKTLHVHNFDMILGIEWLERFSPMKIHWAHKWLTIPYENKLVTLQGLLLGSPNGEMVELLQLSPELTQGTVDHLPTEISSLL